MTVGLLIAGVILFAMVVAGVWLMQYAEAEPAARAVGRAPDPAEEDEARESLATPRSSILVDRQPLGSRRERPHLGGGALEATAHSRAKQLCRRPTLPERTEEQAQ